MVRKNVGNHHGAGMVNQARWLAFIALAMVLAGDRATAQATGTTPPPVEEAEEKAWSFSASAYTYFVPDSQDYVQPTVTADHGWLHLEARYQYEGLDSGSAWIGYNFSFGGKVAVELTPMVGGVFGDTSGIVVGNKGSLSWRQLELYSEAEYVFDTNDSADDFFYTWSELTWAPADWFRFGLVVQRTKVYETDFDIQRGLLAAFSYKKADFTACVFNPDADSPTVVLAVALGF